jgi:diguanylate cyclase (GGDEF)-like protein
MNIKKIQVLLVEDNPGDARLMTETLDQVGTGKLQLQHVDRISTALRCLVEKKFDLVLLDLNLPDGKGLETVRRLCETNPQMPVIVLTGMEDDALALAAVKAGAQDYLVKGQVDGARIKQSIRYAIERKQQEELILHLAMHDGLTGLPNMRLFHDRMALAIERARRNRRIKNRNWKMAVMLLDLDNFKTVNDTLGHAQGDLLLQAVAERLQKSIRKSDTLARMGGDEFTLIFENETGMQDAKILAKKIKAVFSQPFQLGEKFLEITASIGICLYPEDGKDSDSLLNRADSAMYQAKCFHNTVCFYHEYKDKS